MLSASFRLNWRVVFSLLGLLVAFTVSAQPNNASVTIQEKPDERILWRLFHAHKINELKQQITVLQQRYPSWRPPNSLLQFIENKPETLVTTIARPVHKKTSSSFCNNLKWHFQTVENLVKQRKTAQSMALYQQVIKRCHAGQRKQLIQHAYRYLNRQDFSRLLDYASIYMGENQVNKVFYNVLKKEYLTKKARNKTQNQALVSELAPLVNIFKDDRLATIIAWRYFDFGQYSKSIEWFSTARNWNLKNEEALYGLMLGLEKTRQYERLLNVFNRFKSPSKKLKQIAARVYKVKAWQAFEQGHYKQARYFTDKVRQLSGEDVEITELTAWVASRQGQYKAAARLFEQLYQETGQRQYAKAAVREWAKVDKSLLTVKARQFKGVLLQEYKKFQSRALYNRKQFLSAYKLTKNEFPDLVNIDSLFLQLGGGFRSKSGIAGTSRLDIIKAPMFTVSYTANGDQQLSFTASRVSLYSGGLSPCNTEIGVFPGLGSIGQNTQYSQNMVQQLSAECQAQGFSLNKQKLDDAVEMVFSYRKSGMLSPFFSLGTTPVGGAVSAEPTFNLGFTQQERFGFWGLEGYSTPVRQSILSYTGIKAPYIRKIKSTTGKQLLQQYFGLQPDYQWGRVLQTGVQATAYSRLNEQWSMYGNINGAWLHGKNVADNAMISVSIALGRNFKISGFDYFSIGPSVNYQHFDKNLSHFTFGHGGYFSPEHYYNLGAGINFLTEEGKKYIIRGRFIAGFQGIKEASSPWFPLVNKNYGRYAASHSSGEALDFELKGVWLMTPNLQLGTGIAFRKTNGYQDFTTGLFFRYSLEKRNAVYSTDIPPSLFKGFY